VGVLLAACLLPVCGLSAAPKADPVAAKMAEYMRARARVSEFEGAVLVARRGVPLFRAAYGIADRDHDIPNRPETRFRLGSITKQFTAAAILRLEQQGRLSTSDPVSKHLPDWPAKWRDVTIHHLLSHRAGLPRLSTGHMIDDSGLGWPSKTPPFRSLADLYKPGEELQELDYRPGERMRYSNIGYLVLSLLIEKVSGQPFCAFLDREIFRPLQMGNSGCEPFNGVLKGRATGYMRFEGGWVQAGYVDTRALMGAGQLYSTVDDLLRWNRALESHPFLTAESKRKLFTPVEPADDPESWNYAYGWWSSHQQDRPTQWHRGTITGSTAYIARYPDDSLFVTVLSNKDLTPVHAIANELASIALGEAVELPHPRKAITIDPAMFDALVGDYRRGARILKVRRDGDKLTVQIPGPPPFEVQAETPSSFFDGETNVRFVRGAGGEVKALLLRYDGDQLRWERVPGPPAPAGGG
jgi:CubicO group peptidase (beta-lactamase class C family)